MSDPKDIHNELKQISPRLAEIDKKENYDVPEGYFDQLSEEILRKTVKSNRIHYNSFFSSNRVKAFAAAACLGLIILAGLRLSHHKVFNNKELTPEAFALEYIDSEVMVDFLLNHQHSETDNTENQILDEIDENIILEEL